MYAEKASVAFHSMFENMVEQETKKKNTVNII
jgi:hypothetical protein